MLIADKLQGAKPAKLCIARRGPCGTSLQLRFSSPDLVLGNTISLSINGCMKTLEELQMLLYTTEAQQNMIGTWIHGDDCRATILKCESRINEKHATTGKGPGTVIGEMHYTGPCTLTFTWDYTGAKPPITIEASTSYAKFMWDPRA
jgi:hypothetical protein